MWRRCVNLAAAVSLVVCVAVLLLWGRSYLCSDEITYRGQTEAVRLRSFAGWIEIIRSRFMMSIPGLWFLVNARNQRGSMLVDMPDITLSIPYFSLFAWTAALPAWRFGLPLLRRRVHKRGFEVGDPVGRST